MKRTPPISIAIAAVVLAAACILTACPGCGDLDFRKAKDAAAVLTIGIDNAKIARDAADKALQAAEEALAENPTEDQEKVVSILKNTSKILKTTIAAAETTLTILQSDTEDAEKHLKKAESDLMDVASTYGGWAGALATLLIPLGFSLAKSRRNYNGMIYERELGMRTIATMQPIVDDLNEEATKALNQRQIAAGPDVKRLVDAAQGKIKK